MVPSTERQVTVTCDKCKREFPLEDYATNEIIVAMDQDSCVSYVHRRDYCIDCLGDIWVGICRLIGADPDQEGRTGFEDD